MPNYNEIPKFKGRPLQVVIGGRDYAEPNADMQGILGMN